MFVLARSMPISFGQIKMIDWWLLFDIKLTCFSILIGSKILNGEIQRSTVKVEE